MYNGAEWEEVTSLAEARHLRGGVLPAPCCRVRAALRIVLVTVPLLRAFSAGEGADGPRASRQVRRHLGGGVLPAPCCRVTP